MPGILPMKIIKIGVGSAQSRIAQACDRCRSKKIRCDGIRPSCTQCVNVGFECKTSDKLSRRAFPRGYTESLEERVRALELEVREFKDLLDEKEEKIDMLSRLHSHSPRSTHTSPRHGIASPASYPDSRAASTDKDDIFKVTQSPVLLQTKGSDAYFVGTSSARGLIDAFKTKLHETGNSSVDVQTSEFFKSESTDARSQNQPTKWKAPPRILTDQLINIFFQEWAPIFPVLHGPTLLKRYGDYVVSPDAFTDKTTLAQLHLVFGIAAQSSQNLSESGLPYVEQQWRAALESFIFVDSMATLQCLALAQIYCLLSADYAGVSKYKGLAVSLAYRLGLYQSQKRFALGTLTMTRETRKKVFWTLYTLDCFSAAQIGLPKLMKEEDIHCEYPDDVDDEFVTEKGFLPIVPGESTKISTALALFRSSRILAKVLTELYPASPSYELSLRSIMALSDELDLWHHNLPSHLRLQFVQDKPSTEVIHSRSPPLTLSYHYIRSLIHRPAVCASNSLGDRAGQSIINLAGSAKPILQIIQLLEERNMCFAFCLNKNELLTSVGFSLLFQCLDLERDSKVMKCNYTTIKGIVELLDRNKALGGRQFRYVASSVLAHSQQRSLSSVPSSTQEALRATQKQLKAMAARFSPDRSRDTDEAARHENCRTAPILNGHPNISQASITSTHSEPPIPLPQRHSTWSPNMHRSPHLQNSTSHPQDGTSTNLDFLSFPQATARTHAHGHAPMGKRSPVDILRARHFIATNNGIPTQPEPNAADWDRLTGPLDQADTNIYDTTYGCPRADALSGVDPSTLPLSVPLSHRAIEAQNMAWDYVAHAHPHKPSPSIAPCIGGTGNGGGPGGTGNGGGPPGLTFWNMSMPDVASLDGYPTMMMASPAAMVPRSVISFSDDSLTSGEEFGTSSGVSSVETGRGLELGLELGRVKREEPEMFGGLVGSVDYASNGGMACFDDRIGM